MAITRRLVGAAAKRDKKTKATREEDLDFELPDEPMRPSDDLKDYSILLYGPKKLGKTTLANEFDEPLICCTEPGTKALTRYELVTDSWPKFRKTLKLLAENPKRFGTVVVDTIDVLYDLCFEWKCRDLGIDHPHDENDYGKSWQAIDREFVGGLRELLSLGRGVIFISHSNVEEITARSGKTHSQIGTTMKKSASRFLEAVVDIWAYYHYENGRRVLRIVGDELISAGSRLTEHFLTTKGRKVRSIDMGESSKEAYENFVAAFNNELKDVEPDGGGKGDDEDAEPREVRRSGKKRFRR